jgi:exosortase D (VPLPA-CTERM-specific)
MYAQGHTIGIAARTSRLAPAWPWLIVTAAGMAAFYWEALASLGVAWQRPEYSYGPMVPLITAWMTLRQLHRHPPGPEAGSRAPGMMLVAAGLLLGLLGNLSRVPDVGTYGFILAIGGFMLILAGTREGLRFWPGWVHLIFMLPLPQFLYLHISTSLQAISSQLGVGLIDALGIPVILDGNIIDLGSYQLQVAEACSGLNYLFPMLSFGWLVAMLYIGPNWHRAVIFLSTIPITILMNAFRIGVIGILVNHGGIEHAQGFIHVFEGWIIFMACTAMLYGEAWLLQKLAAGGRAYPAVLDLDYRGMLRPLRKLPQLRASGSLIAASLLVLLSGAAWQAQPEAAPARLARESLTQFPLQLGDWRGQPNYLDAPTLRALGADDYLSASYIMGPQSVELLMTFYLSQTGVRSGVHSPEVCLPAGGWEVQRWARKSVPIGQRSLLVNHAVIRKGSEQQLVYYWFEQRGLQTASEYAAKFLSLRDAIATGRSDGGLVRLVTPIGRAEDITSAEARLESIMQRVVPLLPAYFPQS